MSNRYLGNQMPLRPNANTTLMDKIGRRTCYHVDAWIMQSADDVLYLVMQGSAGGQQILERRAYRLEPGALYEVPHSAHNWDGYLARQIGTAWANKYAPWLKDTHWRLIWPHLRIPRAGFTGHQSVRLHYVWSNPKIDDPMEGIVNHYANSARAARDASRVTHRPPMPTVDKPAKYAPYSRRERSLLRTLDKLLK